MKSFRTIGFVFFISVLCLSSQDLNTDQPGYVNLSGIIVPESVEENDEIDLPMIRGCLEISGDSADIHVNARSFRIRYEDKEKVESQMEDIENRLKKKDWVQMIRIRKGQDFMNISLKYQKDPRKCIGLMLMAFKMGNEAVWVNIYGSNLSDVLDRMDLECDSEDMDCSEDETD